MHRRRVRKGRKLGESFVKLGCVFFVAPRQQPRALLSKKRPCSRILILALPVQPTQVVRRRHRRRLRCFGTHGSREDALLANRIAHVWLGATGRVGGRRPSGRQRSTADEIESSAKKAKEAVATGGAGSAGVHLCKKAGRWVRFRTMRWEVGQTLSERLIFGVVLAPTQRVLVWYRQRNRCFGSYGTREEALVANLIAREQLGAKRGANEKWSFDKEPLTADEIESKVQHAKEAVAAAMSGIEPGSSTGRAGVYPVNPVKRGQHWVRFRTAGYSRPNLPDALTSILILAETQGVQFWYQQQVHSFGTYGSREEALLDNRIAHERLGATRGLDEKRPFGHAPLTADEIESSVVRNAKGAAAEAIGGDPLEATEGLDRRGTSGREGSAAKGIKSKSRHAKGAAKMARGPATTGASIGGASARVHPDLHNATARGIKPQFASGDRVCAAWWEDALRSGAPAWYPGVIKSCEEVWVDGDVDVDDRQRYYGPQRLYSVQYDDGDDLDRVEDCYVFSEEDYLILTRNGYGQVKGVDDCAACSNGNGGNANWIGMRNVTDKESSDRWVNTVGWYNVTLADGTEQSFSLLSGRRFFLTLTVK